jgi:hypothetical protein
MPLHDGWPVLAACTVPVVAVSNATWVPAAASVVAKPFVAADLVATVAAVLAR